jgi:hypothetical protein
MPQMHPGKLEADPRFPSGPWTGFFLQYWLPGRHTTNLEMTAANGQLTSTGRDWVGPYTMDGTYDLATGRCEFTKQYLGKHRVQYRGVNNGHGIWGVWEIRALGGLIRDKGGFHIWPEGSDAPEESDRTEQAVLEIMRKEFGNRRMPPGSLVIILMALAIGIAAAFLTSWLRPY